MNGTADYYTAVQVSDTTMMSHEQLPAPISYPIRVITKINL
jgi:hypothetical protein